MPTQALKEEHRAYVSAARWAVVASSWLYAGGVVLQVFCIGMVLLAGQGAWLETHRLVGHWIGLAAILALVNGLAARLPWPYLALAGGLVVLHGLQYAFIGAAGGSFVRAFHAANAVILFWLAVHLGQRVSGLLRRTVL